jgi:hypothetical protein
MAEPVFMKLGMYIMTPEPISASYFISPFHQSVCLCVCRFLRNGSVKYYRGNKYTCNKEELLEASFPIRSMSYQRKEGD